MVRKTFVTDRSHQHDRLQIAALSIKFNDKSTVCKRELNAKCAHYKICNLVDNCDDRNGNKMCIMHICTSGMNKLTLNISCSLIRRPNLK